MPCGDFVYPQDIETVCAFLHYIKNNPEYIQHTLKKMNTHV